MQHLQSLAHFGLFILLFARGLSTVVTKKNQFSADNLPFWRNSGSKMVALSTENLSLPMFVVAVCQKIATSCLPTFFTVNATGPEWLDKRRCSVAYSIGSHFL